MPTHSPHPITTTTKTFTNRTTHVDTTKTITHIGLCAGYGGIELGLGRVIPTLRSVALCEIEAFPIANLVSKMEAGLMDAAPVWTDLKSFPWESFRDRVDILTGGYPCQPFSAAGKRAGKDDPRHLWPWIADGIRILRPRMCFFENVEGHISLGLSSVISDLEELGYKVSWGIFSAREVGAPHQRKRVFILAYDKSLGLEGLRECCESQGWEAPIRHAGSCGDSWQGSMADTNHQHGYGEDRGGNPEAQGVPSEHWQEEHSRWQFGRADAEGHQAWPSRPGEPQHAWEPPRVVGNTTSQRPHRGTQDGLGLQPEVSGERYEAMGNSELRRCESRNVNREETEESGAGCDQLGNASNEGYSRPKRKSSKRTQGESNGHFTKSTGSEIEPTLGRDPHGTSDWVDYAELYTTCDSRTDELRLLGNGVVPSTAERAFRTLLKDITCHN